MNRVKLTTTTTGTGDITVSTTPAARCLPLSSIATGKLVRMLIEDENGTDWELSDCTVLTATTFSRGKVWNGSAGPGVKVNFGAGVKSAFAAAILVDPVIPFNATIPLDRPEIAYMTPFTMTGPLTLTAGANPVDGAHVVATIIGDGTNDLAISGAVKHASSLPFNKTAGAKNIAQFLRTPGVTRYSISQAAADVVATGTTPATPAPTNITMTGPSGGVVNTASGNFSVNTNVARTTAVVVTPTPVAGVTFTPTSVTLPVGSAAGTFTATPTTTGAKTIAVTNDSSLTNPASITYTATASATVPAAPTIGAAVAGDGYIDVYFTRNSDGGSAVLDSTATLSTGQTATGTSSPIRVTAPNGTSATATVKDRNAVGLSAASAASNSVTPAAAPTVTYTTMIPEGTWVESGTSPKIYTAYSETGPLTYGWGGNATKHFGAQTDGMFQFKLLDHQPQWILCLNTSASEVFPSNAVNGISAPASLPYEAKGGIGTTVVKNSIAHATGDIVRLERVNSTGAAGNTALLKGSVSKDNGVTFTPIFEVTGFSNALLYLRISCEGKSLKVTECQETGLVA